MTKYGIVLMLLFLSSCAPVDMGGERSVAMQSIDATQQAAEQQAQLDAQAAIATQQALETQIAMQSEMSMLSVTAQALDIEKQQREQQHVEQLAALDLQRQALELAERRAGMPLTQVAQQATVTAVVAESEERVNHQQQDEVLTTLVPVLLCVGGFTLIGTIGYGIVSYINAQVARQRYIETSLGPVYFLPSGDWMDLREAPEIIEESRPLKLESQHAPPEVWTSPGGSTAFSSAEKSQVLGSNGARNPGGAALKRKAEPVDDYTLVRNFCRHAAQISGPLEQQFPRWDAMDWHSDQWQRAVKMLKSVGLVFTAEREGTWVNTERYPNIGALSAAIHMRKERI